MSNHGIEISFPDKPEPPPLGKEEAVAKGMRIYSDRYEDEMVWRLRSQLESAWRDGYRTAKEES